MNDLERIIQNREEERKTLGIESRSVHAVEIIADDMTRIRYELGDIRSTLSEIAKLIAARK